MIDIERMEVRFLSGVDGVDAHTSWNGSYSKTRDGLLLFGGTKGIAVIRPNAYHFNDLPKLNNELPLAVAE